MKLLLSSPRELPRRRLLVTAIAFIATGVLLTVPASAMQSSSATSSQRVLIGIGDSYTAGVGNTPYTVDSLATDCDRSKAAYPSIVASQLQMKARNYACSGATTAAFSSSFKAEAAQTSQLEDATAVVFTIGGNDVGALQAAATGDLSGVPAALDALPAKLDKAYNAVKTAAPKADIFAVTYPDIFPTDDATFLSCRPESMQKVALTDLHAAIAGLNATIKATAEASGVKVIDASESLSGHDICSETPWVFGMHSSAPLHPNTAGQQAIADVVASGVKDVVDCASSTTSSSTTSTTSPDSESDECGCDHDATSTSTSTSSTLTSTSSTTSSSTSTTLVVPATVATIRPTSSTSSTVVTTTSIPTSTSTAAPPSTSSTSTTEKPAEVKSETRDRNQLAKTGADVTRDIAIATILLGIGLGLVWLRNYVRTR